MLHGIMPLNKKSFFPACNLRSHGMVVIYLVSILSYATSNQCSSLNLVKWAVTDLNNDTGNAF